MEKKEPIAITGIGCRFPGASGPYEFWDLLSKGGSAIGRVPEDRFDIDSFFDPRPRQPGKLNCRTGGFLDRIDHFDAAFFGVSPREAIRMDPQQRLMLEVTWEALEDGGLPLPRLAATNTGVFMGICASDYEDIQYYMRERSEIDFYVATGTARSVLSGRVSYAFDLRGPSLTVDTACSSSLVAVHLACQSLWNAECDLAIVGGANLVLRPELSMTFSSARMLASDGRCKFGDSTADGFARSDGIAAVVLKPLSRAVRDRDSVYAVILGTAVNNDGASGGLLATPSPDGQEAVLRRAYHSAGVSPCDVSYIEVHGTGTPAGDPVEVAALGRVLAAGRGPNDRCILGSVKTNIGHTEGAAGLAGLIKTALCLKHRLIPPSLYFSDPNPAIDWEHLPVTVATDLMPLPGLPGRAIAGVSGFGLSATNAHLVLREAAIPETASGAASDVRSHLLPLSARTPAALRDLANAYIGFTGDGASALADICYTAGARRTHHEYRAAVVANTRQELKASLEALLANETLASPPVNGSATAARRLIFVFPGQGSQWAGMGCQLTKMEPVFRSAIERCDAAFRPYAAWSLLDELAAPAGQSRLTEVDIVQPCLFAIQVGLAELWRHWGVRPEAVVGQSMGEVAAAHIAGALSLEDAARIICQRSSLLKSVSGLGGMAVVALSYEAAERAISGYEDRLSIAVSSSPVSTVISGEIAAIREVMRALEAKSIYCQEVKVNVASHSPAMDVLREDLLEALRATTPLPASIPVYSTVSGAPSVSPDFDACYWVANLRNPVMFCQAVQRLAEAGPVTFLEISPHPLLGGPIQQTLRQYGKEAPVLASLRRNEDERRALLGSAASLYSTGIDLDWERISHGGRLARLPVYPWQRTRFWAGPRAATSETRQCALPVAHLLPGTGFQPASSPDSHFWEFDISTDLFPYLKDHCVQGVPVLPAAFYLEVAAAAAKQIMPDEGVSLSQVEFPRAMVLSGLARRCQVVITSRPSEGASFQFFSREAGLTEEIKDSSWTLHSTGSIRYSQSECAELSLESIKAAMGRCVRVVEADEHYRSLGAAGLHYGPLFRGVDRLWEGEREAIARVKLPERLLGETGNYQMHPALLDSCLQVIAGCTTGLEQNFGTRVPVGVDSLTVYRQPGNTVWAWATLQEEIRPNGSILKGDFLVADEDGNTLIQAKGLRLGLLDSGRVVQPGVNHLMYEAGWVLSKRQEPPAPEAKLPPEREPGLWVVLGDASGMGRRLVEFLTCQGERCVHVAAGESYARSGDAWYTVNPESSHDFARFLNEVLPSWTGNPPGIVHLWSLDAPTIGDGRGDLSAISYPDGWHSAHLLAKELLKVKIPVSPRLWLVTREAQPVTCTERLSIFQSVLWGLGRSIALEHDELQCKLIDLGSPEGDCRIDGSEAEFLGRELLADGAETQIALRGDDRYVARLKHHEPLAENASTREPLGEGQAFRLAAGPARTLDTLELRAVARKRPSPEQIEIKVHACGLNFRDVMLALGVLPGADSHEELGWECAGKVVSVGEAVRDFEIGDEVLALANPCFGPYATTNALLAARKPADLSFEQAAALPLALLTAHYALNHLARLQKGERILIHSVAGGVGLAALRIAQDRGAVVLATAGSEEKREFARSLGVSHVFDSRTLGFAREIAAVTDGEGVDVVLNSLSGQAIAAGVSVLRSGGRFVELGRTDIHRNAKLGLEPFRNNLAFFAVDLAHLIRQRPSYVGPMLRETVDWFVSTGQQPLPVQAFSVREAGEGFRLMARANHIGKVAFKVEGEAIDTTTVSGRGLSLSEEGTYLITGGLGGLGLSVAEWMVDRGARHIVLAGRSEGSAEAQSKVQALGKLAEISSVRVDISDRKETASLLQSIERGVWPLKGVVHAAGVLDDGILTQLDRSRFETVFASKIGGAWNLHSLTRECQLDFFVMFSSAASLLGSSGQANYSAANAFLDSLAHYRRSLGLPGLSINWGAWARVGLAATDYRTRRLAQRGLNGIEPEQGLEALEQLLQDNCPQVAVMDLDMGAWERHYPAATESPYFEALVRHREPNQALTRPAAETQGEAVIGMDPLARRAMMLDRLGELAAEILGYGARRSQSLDLNQPMNKLGLDSLMAVELKGRIAASFGITVPVIDFLKGASLAQLVDQVHDALEARLADKLDAPEGEGVDSTGNGTPRPLALHQKDPLASAPSSIVCDETNRYAPFPLTDIQEAFWVGRGDGVELGGVACHAYYEVDATGLDLRKFKLAFQKLIDRHDMLRAIVLADGSQQVLATVPEYEIEYVDLSSHGAAELGSALESIRSRLSHQVLPADRWPLFEIRASGLTGERIRLHFSFDILIADVASLRILFREWARLYSDIDAELPPLTLTYRDYVLAASAARDSDEFTRSRQYWTNRLAELPSAPELPLHVRPDLIARPRFVRNMGRLDPPRWSRLKELAGEFGLTPSGVLLAAFAEVLAKWSRNPRFTLNVTLMNRVPIHPQVNEIIGDFTVSIPLAVDTSLPEPFRERARRIHLQLLEDIDHGAVSGVRIARDLAKARGTGPVALMPVVFTSLVGQPAGDGADRTLWMGETVYGISQTPQVWLDHQVLEENGGLVFNWDAVDELFPDGLLDEIFQCYSRLLDSLSQEERNWDRHMPALVPAALDAIPLSNFDPTPVPRVLLHNLIADQARKHPQKAAILTEAESISYEELDRRADHLSVELRKRGARRNALVAVIMEKGWEQIAAVLGVLKSGAAYLPIDPGLPRERIWRLLGHGEVNIALTQSWIGERMEWPSGTQCLAVDLEPAAPVKYQREACPQDPDDLAYVIYTSGSTGLPKGVMITHAAAANTILDLNHRFDIGEGDTVLAVSSLSFDLSVYDIFGTLAAGGTLVIPSSSLLRDPGHWAELMNRNRVTIWNSVPALMEMLIEYLSGSERALPESLRLVLLSGDWIPPALPGRIKSISDAHVVALGGATEASIWSILFPVDGTWSGAFSIPYGRPMSNQRVYVLNDAMQPCPAWVTGGLYIAGAGLAAGYWRDDERTKASFIQSVTGERLYRTGDLGRYLPDGNIEFLGREDSQVKILGHRIELGEIEFAILRHEAVKAAVVVTEGTPQRKSLVAYVVADRVPEVGVESLRAFLKRSLPGYMVPSRLVIVDKFPLNANGKVDRGALSKLSAVKDEPAQIRVSGNDLLEQRIGACVASVLGMSQVRAETNLIELGANSVDLIKISCMLEKDLKRKLRLTDLYRCATVKELARSYRGQWLADIEPVSPINGGRYQNPETAAVYEEGEL